MMCFETLLLALDVLGKTRRDFTGFESTFTLALHLYIFCNLESLNLISRIPLVCFFCIMSFFVVVCGSILLVFF